jgi:hypothetical protein
MSSTTVYPISLNISGKYMLKTELSAEKNYGLFFDGATFLGYIIILGYLLTLEDEANSILTATLLLMVVVTQMAGPLWKKGFLAQRLAQRTRLPADGFASGFMNYLLFFHSLLFARITDNC